MTFTCVVCQSELSKYKCSTCYSLYCSLECWNIHKSSQICVKAEKTEQVMDQSLKRSFVTPDTVPLEKLQLLGSNNDLRKLLKNPDLQQILKAVDSSIDPSESVRNAMLEPDFVEFVDFCLKTLGES